MKNIKRIQRHRLRLECAHVYLCVRIFFFYKKRRYNQSSSVIDGYVFIRDDLEEVAPTNLIEWLRHTQWVVIIYFYIHHVPSLKKAYKLSFPYSSRYISRGRLQLQGISTKERLINADGWTTDLSIASISFYRSYCKQKTAHSLKECWRM